MQTAAKTKGDLILQTLGKTVTTTVRDISPAGIKLEFNSEVRTTGRVKAKGLGTLSVWQKTDGTSEWENKGVLTTTQGDLIAAWGKGTGKSTSPTTTAWEGDLHFMSQSPRLSWLNNMECWTEGTADQTKGVSRGKVYQQK
jgi:hypothetical protein